MICSSMSVMKMKAMRAQASSGIPCCTKCYSFAGGEARSCLREYGAQFRHAERHPAGLWVARQMRTIENVGCNLGGNYL